ncbi:MAG: hypothetical protein Q9225_001482 [Loekoesia sp. 1 TL-2023]
MFSSKVPRSVKRLRPSEKRETSFIETKTWLKMPAANSDSVGNQPSQQGNNFRSHTKISYSQALRRKVLVRRVRKRHRFRGYEILPAELILEATKYLQLQDLGNLQLVNKSFAELGTSSRNAIHIGMQREQFPECYKLFGTVNRKTPDQEYHTMIEEENREWWKREEDERFHAWYGFPRQQNHQAFRQGEVGRLDLYSTLAKDIEDVKTALDEGGISFDVGSEEITKKALVLFWKMQWNDRPGLHHLCERTETEEKYLVIRYKLFVDEDPEVRARFVEILKPVAFRLWNKPEFRDYTKDWSIANKEIIRSERCMSAGDLDCWVHDLAAELTVEVISKIGILRALRLNHAEKCNWDTTWINDIIVNRLEERLDETATLLKIQAPNKVFQFGRAIGLEPGDVIGAGESMFSDQL